jgi:uncharacterized glyoxalase superfamily protein PhnB
MKTVPMIHVPDVRATAAWYVEVGFTLARVNECEGLMDWALLSCGETEVMFNAGGHASDAARREVDLYVHTTGIDELFERLHTRVDVVEPPHDTFYGMREFIIRDPNRFWMTFGEPLKP